jgi:hypothetical protein
MSIIKFPKWAVEAINSHMVKFLWDDKEEKHRYHLSNIQSIWLKKNRGALGSLTLET